MTQSQYTPELAAEGGRLIDIFESVPQDKRRIVEMITEAFINGMTAHEHLDKVNQEQKEKSPA